MLLTVTLTGVDVVWLPARSRARAVRAWLPLVAVVVFQETEYGALVSSLPRAAPSRRNWTPTTPTLSLALALTGTVAETVDPPAGAVTDTVGGTLSGVETENEIG